MPNWISDILYGWNDAYRDDQIDLAKVQPTTSANINAMSGNIATIAMIGGAIYLLTKFDK